MSVQSILISCWYSWLDFSTSNVQCADDAQPTGQSVSLPCQPPSTTHFPPSTTHYPPCCHSLINPYILLPSPCLSHVISAGIIFWLWDRTIFPVDLVQKSADKGKMKCVRFNFWRLYSILWRGDFLRPCVWERRPKGSSCPHSEQSIADTWRGIDSHKKLQKCRHLGISTNIFFAKWKPWANAKYC